MNLGETIDALYDCREQRLKLERDAEELRKEETRLTKHLTDELANAGTTAMKGTRASFSIKQEVTPTVREWDKLYEFIKDNNDFSALQKRISVGTWKEYYDDGLVLPGTEAFEITKSFLRKI